ncbi:Ig domain-containing protein, partial [Tropheryma whipplei]|uniref:Ig domain-containing protein n=1 Tax=Tropheryma whipplei TaxID=2039 RepID=UPI0012BC3AAB
SANGLPKGLSIDTTKGTITGSIDTGVTPGEYVAPLLLRIVIRVPVRQRLVLYYPVVVFMH